MSVSEIFVTVGLTVAAAAVIAYTTFKIQTKHRERALFRALLDEVKLNLSRAQVIKSRSMKDKVIYPGLRTEAYDSARLAGVLLSLKEDVREKVHYLYEMIIMHNREISVCSGQVEASYDLRLDRVIRNLELLENELSKKVQKPTKRSDYTQQDWKRRYIVSQVPTFFFFGSLSLIAHHLIVQRATAIMSIGEKAQYVLGWLSLPLGIIAILWAIALLAVGLNLKILSKAKKVGAVITGLIEGDNELFYYIATVTIFGISFASVLALMIQVGMDDLYIYILFGVALLLLLSFVYNMYLSSRQRKRLKNSATQSSESHNHDA